MGALLPLNGLSSWLRAITTLFDLNPVELLAYLLRKLREMLNWQLYPGVYEVLEHEVTLELLDTGGNTAQMTKRQKVRFLQDNIIAYQDKAWGDGNIFAEYQCSPGYAVDRYREGHYYRILISLREAKKRGDIEEFHIQRLITDGFTKAIEAIQTEMDHRTHRLVLRVLFPVDRPPQRVNILELNTGRTQVLETTRLQVLADGRHQVEWEKQHPRLFEAYVLRWQW
jgi:hypothetical protein